MSGRERSSTKENLSGAVRVLGLSWGFKKRLGRRIRSVMHVFCAEKYNYTVAPIFPTFAVRTPSISLSLFQSAFLSGWPSRNESLNSMASKSFQKQGKIGARLFKRDIFNNMQLQNILYVSQLVKRINKKL